MLLPMLLPEFGWGPEAKPSYTATSAPAPYCPVDLGAQLQLLSRSPLGAWSSVVVELETTMTQAPVAVQGWTAIVRASATRFRGDPHAP
jgi:hypothetical protein